MREPQSGRAAWLAIAVVACGIIASIARAQCPSSFESAANYTVPFGPVAVAVGDLNNDGKPDMAVAIADSTNSVVSILLGRGDGTFFPAVNLSLGFNHPLALSIGDFNLDGARDLAVTNQHGHNVTILLGNGFGGFVPAPSSPLPVGTNPYAVVVSDFDADGKPDLAVANPGGPSISIFLGRGDGTFQLGTPVTFPAASLPQFIAVSDFNNDGRADMAVSSTSTGQLFVLLGNGNGTFQGPTGFATGPATLSMTVGDFDRDGNIDLVVPLANTNNIAVLYGHGDGTFALPEAVVSGIQPFAVATGDFNTDGIPDIGLVRYDSAGFFSVLLGNGDRSFQTAMTPIGGFNYPSVLTVADLNGDGLPDVAVPSQAGTSVSVLINHTPGTVLRVDAAATGANNGSSWTHAYRELRDAVAAAQSQPCVREIWVARGTYTPSPPISQGGSRSASFALRSNLAIYGGFAGNETSLSQRTAATIAANPTALSGDLNGDDSGEINRDENSLHIVQAIGTNNASLDGFVIEGGNASAASGTDTSGGGLFCSMSTSTAISSCTFRNNTATQEGGAMFFSIAASSCTVTKCNLADNRITGAFAAGGGGGLFAANEGTQVTIRDSVFLENSSTVGGGAIGARNGAALRIASSSFIRNRATPNGGGGAIAARPAPGALTVVACSFLGNSSAGGEAGDGGAIFADGMAQGLHVLDSLFVGNIATDAGGAATIYDSESTFANCTIVQNTAGPGNCGGVRHQSQSSPRFVYSCVFWRNTDSVTTGPSRDVELVGAGGGSSIIAASTFTNWAGVPSGPLNTGNDPRFLRQAFPGADSTWGTPDDDYGEMRLAPGSPAIDSGDSTVFTTPNGLNDQLDLDSDGNTTEALPLDLGGNPRFYDVPGVPNTGFGSPPVDRGCYEFIPPICPPPNDDHVRNWVSGVGGFFVDPNNWLPCPPDSESHLLFDSGSTFEVTLAAPPARQSKTLRVRSGDVTFVGSVSPSTGGGSQLSLSDASQFSIRVGDAPGRTGVMRLSHGAGVGGFAPTITGDELVVGDPVGSQGSLSLSDASTLRLSGQLTAGNAGIGSVAILSGSLLRCFNVSVGDEPGSLGDITIEGAGSTLSTRSSVDIKRGSLNIRDGGQLAFRSSAGIVTVFKQGTLTGTPTIGGDVECFGTLSPGNATDTLPVGTLQINGDYFQFGEEESDSPTTGILRIDVAGAATFPTQQFDKLDVLGNATFAGGLVVTALPGLTVPADPSTFRIRFAEAHAGPRIPDDTNRFDVALLPAVPGHPDQFFNLVYSPSAGPTTWVDLAVATFSNTLFTDPASPPPVDPTGIPTAVATSDLNGDGLDDLVVATSTHLAYIFINQGPAAPSVYGPAIIKNLPPGVTTTAIAINDIDTLGGPDIAFTNDPGNDVAGFVTFLNNDGLGTIDSFHTPPGAPQLLVGRGPSSLVVANLKNRSAPDFDERPELAVTNRDDNTAAVYSLVNPTNFSFSMIGSPIATGQSPTGLHQMAADSDQGKRSDLLLANEDSNTVTIIPGGSTGNVYTHAEPFSLDVGSRPINALPSRLSGPGAKASVVTVNRGTQGDARDPGSVSVIVKRGAESSAVSFAPAVNLPAGLNPKAIAAADLDNDNDVDLAVITNVGSANNETNRLRILRNDLIAPGSPPNSAGQLAFVVNADQAINEAAKFVLAAKLLSPASDSLVVVSQGGQEGSGDFAAIRPFLGLRFCPADFNHDGELNPDDLGDYITCYFTDPPCAGADFNKDNDVNPDDLGDYITAYFGPPC